MKLSRENTSRTKERIGLFLRQAYFGSENDIILFAFYGVTIAYAMLCTLAMIIWSGPTLHNALYVMTGIYALCALIEFINIEAGNLMPAFQSYGLFKSYKTYEETLRVIFAQETKEGHSP